MWKKVKSKVNGGVWKVARGGENWEKRKKEKIYIIKAIHESVRVGFVPNSELTRRNRVGKKCTRRSNWVGWFRPSMGGGRVGRNHRFEKTARIG